MHTYIRAESVAVDSDEGAFTLEVADENGDYFTVNIHGIDLDAFYDQVKSRIGPYLRERDEAKQAFDVREYRVTEDGGLEPYDISDPKHPDYHSVHADIWDAREGK
jgi:hypothetical protein